jgi:hypothetical protein
VRRNHLEDAAMSRTGLSLYPYQRHILASLLCAAPIILDGTRGRPRRSRIPLAHGIAGVEPSIIVVDESPLLPDQIRGYQHESIVQPYQTPLPKVEDFAIKKMVEHDIDLPERSISACPPDEWGQRRHKRFSGA